MRLTRLLLLPVHAGFPSPADDFHDKPLSLDDLLVVHPASTYFARVQGDSMKNLGIREQDIVVVDRALEATHNSIILACLNGGFLIKKLQLSSRCSLPVLCLPSLCPDQGHEGHGFYGMGSGHCLYSSLCMKEKIFALVDCNNFSVSCERVFHAALREQPVIVMSNNDGCVIARSNEVKKLGVSMGQPVFQIQELIRKHHIHLFSSNFSLYGNMSTRVMAVLRECSPRVEVYSIDDAFWI